MKTNYNALARTIYSITFTTRIISIIGMQYNNALALRTYITEISGNECEIVTIECNWLIRCKNKIANWNSRL